jgi:hypothetical protein
MILLFGKLSSVFLKIHDAPQGSPPVLMGRGPPPDREYLTGDSVLPKCEENMIRTHGMVLLFHSLELAALSSTIALRHKNVRQRQRK